MLYFLITDGYSFNQSAFPFSNTGFSNKLPIVLLNLLAKTAHRDVFLEYLLML